MADQFFEMLWDCESCSARGLLAKAQRHCPMCGAAQNPARRYFPEPGQELEVQGHRFVGIDWACLYCESPNAAAAAFCGNCGGPRDGSKTVTRIQDHAPETASPTGLTAPAQSSPAPGWPWLKVLGALILVACSVLAFLFLSKHDEPVQIVDKSWSREIDVERLTALKSTDWCDAMPADAYQISRSREQRSTRQVEAGEVCVDSRTDQGDGTFTKRRECSPRYRNEPVFDNKCSYRVNRWQVLRTDRLAGDARLAPAWPSLLSGNTLLPGNSLGAERSGQRRETYRVKLQSPQGGSWQCDLSPEVWSRLAENQLVALTIRGTGGADCNSLKAE